jgi:hypothetical protein
MSLSSDSASLVVKTELDLSIPITPFRPLILEDRFGPIEIPECTKHVAIRIYSAEEAKMGRLARLAL